MIEESNAPEKAETPLEKEIADILYKEHGDCAGTDAILKAIERFAASPDEWVSVETAQPKEGTYLVWVENPSKHNPRTSVATFDGKSWYTGAWLSLASNVTHRVKFWKPLPAPPLKAISNK